MNFIPSFRNNTIPKHVLDNPCIHNKCDGFMDVIEK